LSPGGISSIPDLKKGLHFKILIIPKATPFIGPWLFIACIVY